MENKICFMDFLDEVASISEKLYREYNLRIVIIPSNRGWGQNLVRIVHPDNRLFFECVFFQKKDYNSEFIENNIKNNIEQLKKKYSDYYIENCNLK